MIALYARMYYLLFKYFSSAISNNISEKFNSENFHEKIFSTKLQNFHARERKVIYGIYYHNHLIISHCYSSTLKRAEASGSDVYT